MNSAFGASAVVPLQGINTTLVPVSTSQTGVGSQTQHDQLLAVNIPATGPCSPPTSCGPRARA